MEKLKDQRSNLRFTEQVYSTRDVEGKYHPELGKRIREVEKELEKYKEFVGIVVYGSTVGGYSMIGKNYNLPESDIDIHILVDIPDLHEFVGQFRKTVDKILDLNNEQLSSKPHRILRTAKEARTELWRKRIMRIANESGFTSLSKN